MWGGAGARSVHGGPDSTLRARHARGRTLNIQAISVTLDVSRLSGWLNAEAPCRVTRRHMEGDAPGEGRGGVGGGRGERSGHGGSWGQGARGGHTMNMAYMFVTLDVSQLETFSLKLFKPENSSLMSVIDETTQPEIGPCVLRAVARSLTHIWTAVFREAVVVKEDGGDNAPAVCTDAANTSMRALGIGPWEAGASSGRLTATPPATAANMAAIAEEPAEEPAEKPPLRPMPPPLDPWCWTSMSAPKLVASMSVNIRHPKAIALRKHRPPNEFCTSNAQAPHVAAHARRGPQENHARPTTHHMSVWGHMHMHMTCACRGDGAGGGERFDGPLRLP